MNRAHCAAILLALFTGCSDSNAEGGSEAQTESGSSSATDSGDASTSEAETETEDGEESTSSADSSSGGGQCGDGNLDDNEECDDGNLDDGDACSSQCTEERFSPEVFPLELDPAISGDFEPTPSGELWFASQGGGATQIYRLAHDGSVTMEEGFYAEDCRTNDLSASEDGRFFFTADSCGCLNRIDRESSEGREEYFCDTSNGTHAASLAFVPEAFGFNPGQVATAFAPNGAFGGSQSFIDFIDPESQTQTPFVQIDNPITALQFSPDGQFLYALASQIQIVTEDLNIDVQVVSFLYRIDAERSVELVEELPFMATNVVFGSDGQMFFASPREGFGEFASGVGGDGLWSLTPDGTLTRLNSIDEDIGEGFAPDALHYDGYGLLYVVQGEVRQLDLQ